MDSVTPGEFLRALLKRRKMSVMELATRCGVPYHRISSIIYRNSRISPDLMLRFELVTGIPAERWRNMQGDILEARARNRKRK